MFYIEISDIIFRFVGGGLTETQFIVHSKVYFRMLSFLNTVRKTSIFIYADRIEMDGRNWNGK